MPKLKPPIINGEPLLTLRQVADRLGYTTRWIYQMVYSGELNAVKRGNCWFFLKDDVDKHLPTMEKPGRQEVEGGMEADDIELAAEV